MVTGRLLESGYLHPGSTDGLSFYAWSESLIFAYRLKRKFQVAQL
jgi:hypothetical protein